MIYTYEDIKAIEASNKMIQDIWKEDDVIDEIASGKHDDVFDEEDKKEVTQMIEQDNYDMRIQRILSGIKKDIKDNFKKYKKIFGTAEKKVA